MATPVRVKELPPLKAEQSVLMKEAIVSYFMEREVISRFRV
jgi:hypothetical protein